MDTIYTFASNVGKEVLPQSLQEGWDVLAKLAAKWPKENVHVSQNAPLWKDGLAVMDAGWAQFAAQSIGWLDQSSTALVLAGKEMSGQDPMLAYSQLGAKLEKLLNEVSRPNQSAGFMDNWHILRRPTSEPATVRLEKILEEKASLDAIAGSRMRGLRDALEMRDLSREALAILSNAGSSLRLHMHEVLEKEKKSADENNTPPSPLTLQKAERAQRQFRRTTSALDIIQERLTHEFSGSSSDLGSLDDAVHQEELMHSRIDGLASKIASTIAGEGLKQLAQDQAEHSKAIAVEKSPELTPTQLLEQQLPVIPRKTGFLDRLFSRTSSGAKVSRESDKILRNMNKLTSGIKTFMEGHGQDEFWANIVKLMSDEAVSPSHKIGSKTLLGLMFEMANANDTEDLNGQYSFESKLSLITMFVARHPDGPKELRAIIPTHFSPLCSRAILGTKEEQNSTPPHRPLTTVAHGFLLWETAGDDQTKQHFNGEKVIAKFLLVTPFLSYWPANVREKAVKVMQDALLSHKFDRLDDTKMAAAETVLSYLSTEAVTKFGLLKLTNKIRDGAAPAPEDIAILYKIGLPACDKLAATWLSYTPNADAGWARELLLANEKHMVATPLIEQTPEDEPWWGEDSIPYLPMEVEKEKMSGDARSQSPVDAPRAQSFSARDYSNLTILSQYNDMILSGKPQKQWPEELCNYAFIRNDIKLFNDLIQKQPKAKIFPTHKITGAEMLSSVINADIQRRTQIKSDNFSSSTDPDYWCKVLSSFVDGKQPTSVLFGTNERYDNEDELEENNLAGSDDVDDIILPEIPRQTPLMVACSANALPWIKALLKAGANPKVKDSKGDTAMVHWCHGIKQFARNTSSADNFRVSRHGHKHSEVNEAKATEIYNKLVIASMNHAGFWDLEVANMFSQDKTILLTEALYLEIASTQKSEVAGPPREPEDQVRARQLGIENFVVTLPRSQFIESVSLMVSPPGKLSPHDPGIEKAIAYGRKAGLFDASESREIAETITEQSKRRAMRLMEERNRPLMNKTDYKKSQKVPYRPRM